MDEVGAEIRIHDSTGKRKIGISDLLFLAYNSMKREAAGKPVKGYEVWCETVADIEAGNTDSPKATPPEA
tara:strand:+ start:358 stop:567 length:210 start_codon:yes stop_codon:yes gene_type:complete